MASPDAGGTVDVFAEELGRVLTGLEDVLTPGNASALLRELGVDTPPDLSADLAFTQALAAAADVAAGLEPAVAAVADAADDATAQALAVAELLDLIRRLVAALHDVGHALEQVTATLPDATELAGFAATFAERLLGAAVVGYLDVDHPFLRRILSLLTIVEMETTTPTTPDVAPVLRRRLHPERAAGWISDPLAVLRDGYGWGDNAFDPRKLFRNVSDVFGVLYPLAEARDAERDVGADLDFYNLVVQATTGAVPPGLEATLYFDLPAAFDLLLGEPTENTRATLHVQAALPTGLRLRLLPPATLEIPDNESATGTVAVSLVGESPDPATPFVVFGAAGGSRLEAVHISAAVTATLVWDAAANTAHSDLGFALDLTGCRLVLDPSSFDGFLRSVLPADGLQASFDFGLTWSAERGFAFRGAAGLEATVPLSLSLGPVSVFAIHLSLQARDAGITAEVSTGLGTAIGPVQVAVDRLGVATRVTFPDGGGNLGVADLEVGFKPPTGLALSIDAGIVSGGGTILYDPDREQYAGQLDLQFGEIAVKAVGVLTTRLPDGSPGFSLLVIVSAEFPPVQLGLGFMLVGVGGLLGINRTVAVDALRAGVKTGALAAVLSQPDPAANIAQVVAGLAGLFPPAAGRYVFGPTAKIVWGSPTLITIDLCLVLELPAPVRLVVLGRLRAVLPDEDAAIVKLQMDVVGVIDFDRSEASVDASLADSTLAGFPLTGDMAMRLNWGAQPSFLLAVGGFHPRFVAPPGFPVLARVAVALASGDNPRLRLEAYLAVTSNTVQLGARVDLSARAGSFSVGGFLSFDALLILDPLSFTVDIAAQLAVKAGGHTLLSVSLSLTLSGPRPWHARGQASFSILFFDVSFGFDVIIGPDVLPGLPSPFDVAGVLLTALNDVRSWSATLPPGAGSLVTLRSVDLGTDVPAHPFGALEVRQRVAPLERTLERFGAHVPSGASRFEITHATLGTGEASRAGVSDLFAPAQFTALSDEQKLSQASFQSMTAGAAIGPSGVAYGAPVTVDLDYEQQLVTADGVTVPPPEVATLPGDIFLALLATPALRPATFSMRGTP